MSVFLGAGHIVLYTSIILTHYAELPFHKHLENKFIASCAKYI